MKVGVDIIEIERIERALSRPGFRERWLFRPVGGGAKLAVNIKPRVLMTNGLALRVT